MSATVNADLTELVMNSVELSKNLKIVSACSDRPNIKLNIIKIKDKEDYACLRWLVGLESNFKVLIYTRSMELCGQLYTVLLSFFAERFDNPGEIVAMFHAETPPSTKEYILKSLRIDNTMTRIVICTSALECGVNVKNVRYVIHYGPSYDVVDYCQQIGRAGRNTADQCHAVLYTFPNAKRNISGNLKRYMADTKCLRTELYTQFNENNCTIPPLELKHNCCTICSSKCDCGDCPIGLYEVYFLLLSELFSIKFFLASSFFRFFLMCFCWSLLPCFSYRDSFLKSTEHQREVNQLL